MISIDVISTYAMLFFISIVIITAMLKSVKRISTIIINSLIGGTVFIILNILGLGLPVNIISIIITALLGIPGVLLIIVYMLVMGAWR